MYSTVSSVVLQNYDNRGSLKKKKKKCSLTRLIREMLPLISPLLRSETLVKGSEESYRSES